MARNKLLLWQVIFITSLLTANVTAAKVTVLVGGLVVPAAFVAYAFTFLATDVINELYGRETANEIVRFGFVAQALALALLVIAGAFPVAPWMPEMQDAYMMVLGQNFRIVAASMAAYLVSQTLDVHLFAWWRAKTKGKHKWVRNNLSTMASQLVDTAIFITIAFYGVVPDLLAMIGSQYALKFVLALIDTPFFYFFTRNSGEKSLTDEVR